MLKKCLALVLAAGLSPAVPARDNPGTPLPNSRIISVTPGGDGGRLATEAASIAQEAAPPAPKTKKKPRNRGQRPRTPTSR